MSFVREAAPDYPGFHYEWQPEDESWTTDPEIIAGKRCRYNVGPGHRICPAPAAAAFRRSNGWWCYCSEHLYGRRLSDGVVFHRKLVPDEAAAGDQA